MNRWAGWLLCGVAGLHLALAGAGILGHLGALTGNGVIGSVAPPWIPTALEGQVAFWTTLGSFAVPQALLGSWIVWNTQRGLNLPPFIGPALIVLTLLQVLLAPVSGFWFTLLPGLLLCAGQKRRWSLEIR